MKSIFVLCLIISFCSSASANCPDKTFRCGDGTLIKYGTCYKASKAACRPCKENFADACPVAKCDLSSRIDGCSIPLTDPASKNYKGRFQQACNVHDACYHTVGRSKADCDSDFKTNMLKLCNNDIDIGPCKAAANVWYDAVHILTPSMSGYSDDQSWGAAHNCIK